MPKRKTPGPSKPAARVRAVATPDQLLDALDDALLRGDQAALEPVLQDLWRARRQIPEVLTQRLIDGRARVPAFAFQILQGAAGARAASYLRRVATHRSVPDIVRWGAQRRAGWPERGEAKRRLAFLATLQDPDGTLVTAIAQGTDAWPPDGEILDEVMGYLALLPSDRAQAVLKRAVAEVGEPAAWLLHAALHLDDPPTQRVALAELVHLRDPAAAGPVGRLARTARDAGVRAEAEAALQRLRLHVVDAEPVEPLPLPPVRRVVISMVDGAGGQVVIVVREPAPGVHSLADFFHNEAVGIKDTFGRTHEVPERAEMVIEEFEDTGLAMASADLATARGVLAAAVEVNAATGHPLPVAFEIWEPFVHETYPPAPDEPITPAELDDAPYARRRNLLRSSGRLANHPDFETWGFDAPETSVAVINTPPPRGGRLSEQQYEPMLEQLMSPEARARFRSRLRRQAWVLDRLGEAALRDQALAVAAHLSTASAAELARQPFWQRLVARSITNMASLLFIS